MALVFVGVMVCIPVLVLHWEQSVHLDQDIFIDEFL